MRPISKQIAKNCIGIFQAFNDVRNNASFAHDNLVVDEDEARFIFDTVISMLRFVRAVEADSFDASATLRRSEPLAILRTIHEPLLHRTEAIASSRAG